MENEQIALHMTRDEALVLSHLLYRWMEEEKGRTIRSMIEDDAELWAMNALSLSLESIVAETLSPDYEAALEAARRCATMCNGGSWPWGNSLSDKD